MIPYRQNNILLRKFNIELLNKFEHSRADSHELPKVEELINFLELECTRSEAALLCESTKGVHNSSFKSDK